MQQPPFEPPQQPYQQPNDQPTQGYFTQPYSMQPIPGQFQPAAPGSLPPAPPPKKKRRTGCIIAGSIAGGLLGVFLLCILIASLFPPPKTEPGDNPFVVPTFASGTTPTPTITSTQNAEIQATVPSTPTIVPTSTSIASIATPTPTPVAIVPTSTPTLAPTPTPVPSPQAMLGGEIASFNAKLGTPTPVTTNPAIGNTQLVMQYQPYVEIAATQYTYTVIMEKDLTGKNSVYEVRYDPAKPVKWDDGIRTCKSFLPPDAVQKEENDYNTSHELIYMSQSIAKQFPPEAFRQGGKPTAPLITPGTLQIYSHYDAPLFGEKVLKSCTIQLGRVD